MQEYLEQIQAIPENRLVYVDETGIDKCLDRPYGRALRGKKVYGIVRGHRFARTSIIAAQAGKRILAPLQYKGLMHCEFFEYWFMNNLMPLLDENSVVIMDNASFHRKKRLKELVKGHKINIIFLPPYSPELNPIEHFWHWLKTKVSDYLPYCKNLDDAISKAF